MAAKFTTVPIAARLFLTGITLTAKRYTVYGITAKNRHRIAYSYNSVFLILCGWKLALNSMATFKDKYPKICDALCPICKRTCLFKMEKHTDDEGNWTAHVCGPHW